MNASTEIRASHFEDGRLVQKGIRWFCDGVEVPHVISFNMDEGWIYAHCNGCDWSDELGIPRGQKHINREGRSACEPRRHYGRISYQWPDGRVVE